VLVALAFHGRYAAVRLVRWRRRERGVVTRCEGFPALGLCLRRKVGFDDVAGIARPGQPETAARSLFMQQSLFDADRDGAIRRLSRPYSPDDDKSGIRFQGTWLTAQICKPGSLSHGILAGLALVASVECEKSPASAHQALQGEGLPFFIFSKSTTVGDDAALSRDTSR
jgi:hypothetical protein